MGRVILFMSLSLDGFIAGPNVGIENPMGDGGGRLHDWMFVGKTSQEIRSFEEESFKDTGAIIMGKRTFDVGVGPWGKILRSMRRASCSLRLLIRRSSRLGGQRLPLSQTASKARLHWQEL